MTRMEERLADALRASAAAVRDDRLRPLPQLGTELGTEPGTEPGTQPETGPGTGPRQAARARAAWRVWLAPVAAAASVALVIGLALGLTGAPGRMGGQAQAGRGSTAATPVPKYYLQLAGTKPEGATVTIRSVTSRVVITSAAAPQPAGWDVQPYAMAAAPDGRTFYVAYDATRPGRSGASETWIYRLNIPDSHLTRIAGGVIPSATYFGVRGSLAVSPDGTRLALTVARTVPGYAGPGSVNEIVVIDLRTGGRSAWRGGLDLPEHVLLIPDVSWTADGRSLVFLAVWCNPAAALNLCEEAFGPVTSRAQQVRSVPAAAGGGSLARGAVLARTGSTTPVITHAVAGPRPDELTLVLMSGRTTTAGAWPVATVQRVAARTGTVLGTDYRLVAGRYEPPPRDIELGADPSGQHLLLTYYGQGGFFTGQIGQGKFRPLPNMQPYRGYPITAW